MINFLLSAAILVWPFGQLLGLSPWGQPLRLQALDVLAFCLTLALLINQRSRQLIKTDPLSRPFFLFISAAALSLLVNSARLPADGFLFAFAYFFRFVCYFSFYFAFRLTGVKKYRRLLLLSVAIFLSLGLFQYFFLPDVRFLAYLGFDDHYYRLVGTLFDPNFTGLLLAVFCLLCLTYLPGKRKLVFLLPLFGLVLTFSRASYLALAFGLVFLAVATRRFRLLLALVLLAILVYFVPKPFGEGVNLRRTFSIVSRFSNQKQALYLLAQKPLFGYGFNTLKKTNGAAIPNLTSGVDNSYLFVLATTGLFGFSAFLYLLKTAYGLNRTTGVRASLVAIFGHSLFNNSLFMSWILAFFLLLVSLRSKKSALL